MACTQKKNEKQRRMKKKNANEKECVCVFFFVIFFFLRCAQQLCQQCPKTLSSNRLFYHVEVRTIFEFYYGDRWVWSYFRLFATVCRTFGCTPMPNTSFKTDVCARFNQTGDFILCTTIYLFRLKPQRIVKRIINWWFCYLCDEFIWFAAKNSHKSLILSFSAFISAKKCNKMKYVNISIIKNGFGFYLFHMSTCTTAIVQVTNVSQVHITRVSCMNRVATSTQTVKGSVMIFHINIDSNMNNIHWNRTGMSY